MDDDTQGADDEGLSLIFLPPSVLLNRSNCDCDEVESDNLSVGSVGTDVPAIIQALQEDNDSEEDMAAAIIHALQDDTDSEVTAGAEDVPVAYGVASRAREEDVFLHIGASWMRKYHELKVSTAARG